MVVRQIYHFLEIWLLVPCQDIQAFHFPMVACLMEHSCLTYLHMVDLIHQCKLVLME